MTDIDNYIREVKRYFQKQAARGILSPGYYLVSGLFLSFRFGLYKNS